MLRKKFKVRTGDLVEVVAGKDKGKQGKILKLYLNRDRVLVEGVNVVKKHVKPSQTNPQGGITTHPAAIHVSNVMLVDPKTGKPTRTGVKVDEKTGAKLRFAKKSGEVFTAAQS
ncbi:MAG: 50S ribosomal protein L24 [Bdellovibrionaceae bacterium]|nr:50S ribosomal protein L24 [Pseudobdellovibrionaceae bacterium]|tara:strand:- start:57 stop:398 length:342 start_codon:yes stop_codon:yes gene_type:complete